MTRNAYTAVLSLAALVLVGGCQSNRGMNADFAPGAFGPGAFGPGAMLMESAAGNHTQGFRLGAGDALGREVFSYYVAAFHAGETYYATGADDRPQ